VRWQQRRGSTISYHTTAFCNNNAVAGDFLTLRYKGRKGMRTKRTAKPVEKKKKMTAGIKQRWTFALRNALNSALPRGWEDPLRRLACPPKRRSRHRQRGAAASLGQAEQAA